MLESQSNPLETHKTRIP